MAKRPASSPPPAEELQRSLERLHAELAANPHVDAHSRRLMQEVLADLDRLLAGRTGAPAAAGPAATAVETAPDRLRGLAVQFEAHHPLLAASARQFVDLLGRAGL